MPLSPQSLGHLAHRVAPILDLGHRIALELVCEFSSGHLVLLAPKITKQGISKSRGYSTGGYNYCPQLVKQKLAALGLKRFG